MKDAKENTRCLVCGSNKLVQYFNLGPMALANSYVNPRGVSAAERKIPLAVSFCPHCSLSQLTYIVNPKILFTNYAYFSSVSPQVVSHFDEYAQTVTKRFPRQTAMGVLEIASNDGVLLQAFRKRGARVLGVDPAKNIAETANRHGIPTIADFFGTNLVPAIKKKFGDIGVISANNVLAHTDTIHDIFDGITMLLSPAGIAVFQHKYLPDLVAKNQFDTIYHEHMSYYTLTAFQTLLSLHGLRVFDVQHVTPEGGSIRVWATHDLAIHPQSSAVTLMLAQEKRDGMLRASTYKKFARRPERLKREMTALLRRLKRQGKTIAAYGASAKGNTFLQYCGITDTTVNYIVDDSPHKQGKLTPGTHIPIVPHAKLIQHPPDYLCILAWNLADSLMAREAWFAKRGGKFIIALPKLTIV